MLFRSKHSEVRPIPLKPYVLATKDGFLIGAALEPGKGAPCADCVRMWLEDRGLVPNPMELSELRVRRDLIAEVIEKNSPHLLYEVTRDGSAQRLDCAVFPHPECACDKSNYIAPDTAGKRSNFAFSPLTKMQCSRYAVGDSNLWVASARGAAPRSGDVISSFGVGRERAIARSRALDGWLSKAAKSDVRPRMRNGEKLQTEILQTGAAGVYAPMPAVFESVGAGENTQSAVLDALYALTRQVTLRRYASAVKSPMLIVGGNNWLRDQVPFFVMQQYDLHLFFYPNAAPGFVVGVGAFSRQRSDERPIFVFGAGGSVATALEIALGKILEHAVPPESRPNEEPLERPRSDREAHLNRWWTHWVYRCPKISLRDVLHLEAYPASLDVWRDYFRDGQPPVTILSLNHLALPTGLRTVVQLGLPEEKTTGRRVHGIGTLADFQDALA